MPGMNTIRSGSLFALIVAALAGGALMSGCTNRGTGAQTAELTAACIDDPSELPSGGWLCPADATVECIDGVGNEDTIFAVPTATSGLLCSNVDVQVSNPGPFPLGTSEVVITAQADGSAPVELCRTHITVVDTLPPEVTPLTPAPLWPPNHSMHAVTVADCAQIHDLCDPNVDAHFTSVTSDEPRNALGDGNTEPDVQVVDCGTVKLRAERQGTGNGRVYTLHWAADDHAGHVVTGSCMVDVPHDQSGAPAVADAPVYEVSVCP